MPLLNVWSTKSSGSIFLVYIFSLVFFQGHTIMKKCFCSCIKLLFSVWEPTYSLYSLVLLAHQLPSCPVYPRLLSAVYSRLVWTTFYILLMERGTTVFRTSNMLRLYIVFAQWNHFLWARQQLDFYFYHDDRAQQCAKSPHGLRIGQKSLFHQGNSFIHFWSE